MPGRLRPDPIIAPRGRRCRCWSRPIRRRPESRARVGRGVIPVARRSGGATDVPEHALAQMFALSPAQTRLVAALVAGESMADYADAVGVTMSEYRRDFRCARSSSRRRQPAGRSHPGGRRQIRWPGWHGPRCRIGTASIRRLTAADEFAHARPTMADRRTSDEALPASGISKFWWRDEPDRRLARQNKTATPAQGNHAEIHHHRPAFLIGGRAGRPGGQDIRPRGGPARAAHQGPVRAAAQRPQYLQGLARPAEFPIAVVKGLPARAAFDVFGPPAHGLWRTAAWRYRRAPRRCRGSGAMRMARWPVVFAVLALSAPALAQGADTILLNGKIVTLDAARTGRGARGARRQDRRGRQVRRYPQARRHPRRALIDLGGRTVIPGPDRFAHARDPRRAVLRHRGELDRRHVDRRSDGAHRARRRKAAKPGAMAHRRRRLDRAAVRREAPPDPGRAGGRGARTIRSTCSCSIAPCCSRPRASRRSRSPSDADVPPRGKIERDASGKPTGWIAGDNPTIIGAVRQAAAADASTQSVEGTRAVLPRAEPPRPHRRASIPAATT